MDYWRFFSNILEYRRLIEARLSGNYQVVEGIISDFVPMPYEGHKSESFTVNGRRFEYSDFHITAGFNQSASHGGPIRAGQKVRIAYVGNAIIKLEIDQEHRKP